MSLKGPNYTQIPNTILHLAPEMKEAELRLILAICRQTFGFHKKEDKLSLSQLQDLTGLSRQGVCNALKQKHAKKYVKREKNGNGYNYSLKVVNEVDHPLVNELDHPPDEVVNELDSASQSSLPEVVNELDTQKKRTKENSPKEKATRTRDDQSDDRSVGEKAVDLYKELVPRRPNTIQVDRIKTVIDDLELWEETIRWWVGRGHRNKNVHGMTEKFLELKEERQGSDEGSSYGNQVPHDRDYDGPLTSAQLVAVENWLKSHPEKNVDEVIKEAELKVKAKKSLPEEHKDDEKRIRRRMEELRGDQSVLS